MRAEARLHRLERAYLARRLSAMAEGEIEAGIRVIDRYLSDPAGVTLSADEADMLTAIARLFFVELP